MPKSRFFRVAVEGATTDGRVIERNWIEEMAAGYNPATYTARVNCEHIRGFSPDAPFNAYGSITALKAEEIDLALDGKTEKRLALFAEIDANDQLVALNKKGQKLFTSVEISPNFASTGKAGLVGLAVTDNPASLGTEILQFAAAKPMFDARKLDKANLFSAAQESAIELAADETADNAGILASIKGLLDTFASKFAATEKPGEKEKEEPVTPPVAANDNDMAAFAKAIGDTVAQAIGVYATANDGKVTQLSTDLAALTAKLEKTEQPSFARQVATGGGGAIVTDC